MIFPVSGGAGSCGDQTFDFTNQGLSGCRAITSCSEILVDSILYYQVVSQGQCNIGNPLQATRTLEIRLKQVATP